MHRWFFVLAACGSSPPPAAPPPANATDTAHAASTVSPQAAAAPLIVRGRATIVATLDGHIGRIDVDAILEGAAPPTIDFIAEPNAVESGVAIYFLQPEGDRFRVVDHAAAANEKAVIAQLAPGDAAALAALEQLFAEAQSYPQLLGVYRQREAAWPGEPNDPASLDLLFKIAWIEEEKLNDVAAARGTLQRVLDLQDAQIRVQSGTVAVDETDKQIVKTVIALAHALGMRVVAEGVDSAEAVAAVAELECDMAQGFFIGRPMRGDLVPDWMTHYSAGAMRRSSVVRSWPDKPAERARPRSR